jgi:hypothetical protein
MEPKKEMDELWTLDQLAEFWNCSKKTIYAKTMPSAKEKLPIPVIRVGKLLRFRKSDVLRAAGM